MDIRYKTFWEMEKESISYARKNESVWAAKAVIVATVSALEANERELDLAFKAQDENDPGGHVAQKNAELTVYCRKIYKLGRKLLFYAKDKNDKVLLNDVDFSESKLLKFSEKKALLKCHTVITRGNEYLPQAADYDVTAEELEALATELAVLEQMQPTIGVITNERKSAGRSIKELISDARQLLSKLDDAFEGMIDNDDFINGWFAIRKIKGRHKAAPKNEDNGGTPTA
jgi:hypothetical protein